MGLTIDFINNSSPIEKIGKNLTVFTTMNNCLLKENTSVLKPVIRIRTNLMDIMKCNYMYIHELSRYYFIDNIESINFELWEISGHVDVLETYKAGILSQQAVIKRQQNSYNLYLNDPDFRTYNNDLVQTKKFTPSAFNKVLNYVLVVNGS